MMRCILSRVLALFLALVCTCASADFPLHNPYAATVIGTPKDFRAQLPREIPVKEYTLAGLHPVPDFLWYSKGLVFSASLQDGPAPLVFNIGGTGAAYNGGKVVMLQKALYQAGFHVISLSSPTHMNFMINGSRSSLPGYLPDDAEDLYRVMKLALAKVKSDSDITVTDLHVVGYSLGGAHAAFVARLDQQQKKLGLNRVYVINPPVRLYGSVRLLDQMLNDNVEGGAEGIPAFIDQVVRHLAEVYKPKQGMKFDEDFLYKAYEYWGKNDEALEVGPTNGAAALIAISFRMTSASMVFTADLMNRLGYIIPKDEEFRRYEPLIYYSHASHAVEFAEYVDDLLIPYLQQRQPGLSREELLQQASLHHIQGFLADYPAVRVVTNRDELILEPEDLTFLEQTLGRKLRLFEYGGHCGNINSRENIDDMIRFLKGGQS